MSMLGVMLLSWFPMLSTHAGLLPITPEALEWRRANGDAPLVIDVRSHDEFAAGHVPGAVLLPHDQIQADAWLVAKALGREVIVYCRSGRRAEEAEARLRALGITNIRQMDGHWLAWESAALTKEKTEGGE